MLVSARRRHSRSDLSRLVLFDHSLLTHLPIHQPERQRLISHERLIVTLRVRDALLSVPPVDQSVNNVSDVPLRVGLGLFEQLDPHVGDSHREAVVEADASFGDRNAEGGHAGDVLGNADSGRVEGVDHGVGLSEREWIRQSCDGEGVKGDGGTNEHKVDNSLVIDVSSEVLVVAAYERKRKRKVSETAHARRRQARRNSPEKPAPTP